MWICESSLINLGYFCVILQEELLVITADHNIWAFGPRTCVAGRARDEGKQGISRHTRPVGMEMNILSSITLWGVFLERSSISAGTAEF